MDSTPGHAEERGHAVWGTSTDGRATYVPLLVAFNHGQTLGEKLLAVRVVNEDSSPTGLGRAFVREVLFKIVPSALSPLNLVDYLWAAFREDRRSLHDLGAGTAVIEDDTPARPRRSAGGDRGSWRCTLCGSQATGASCSACGAPP